MLFVVVFAVLVFSIGSLKLADEHVLVILALCFLSILAYVVYDIFATMVLEDNATTMVSLDMVDAMANEAGLCADSEDNAHDLFNSAVATTLTEIASSLPDLLLETQIYQRQLDIKAEFESVLEAAVKQKTLLTEMLFEQVSDEIDYYFTDELGVSLDSNEANDLNSVQGSLLTELTVDELESLAALLLEPISEVDVICTVDSAELLVNLNTKE
jgi:hypothetical protein